MQCRKCGGTTGWLTWPEAKFPDLRRPPSTLAEIKGQLQEGAAAAQPPAPAPPTQQPGTAQALVEETRKRPIQASRPLQPAARPSKRARKEEAARIIRYTTTLNLRAGLGVQR